MPHRVLHIQPPFEELRRVLAALPEKFGLTRDFEPEVLAEARRAILTHELPTADQTALPFVTIDPAGATDLDQAMHLEARGEGFRVYYAIADVPSFVSPQGAIDREARHRGQTIYTPDGRIPLHPIEISEGAASLLPGEERGAFVWQIDLDAAAEVTHVTVARALIRSREQLSYEAAQSALDAGTAGPTLRLLQHIGIARIDLERRRGGASLRIPNVEIDGDEVDGSAAGYRLVRRSPLPIEDWNAQISLLTGMAAAQLMLTGGVGLLRTMPEPEPATLASFRRQADALGHPWPTGMPYGEYLRSLDLRDPRELAITHAAGSLFRGAGYTAFDGTVPTDILQAAVAAPYAHVTAPLRRLVDRFGLVACAALCADQPVPGWVRDALGELPAIMAGSDQKAGAIDRAAVDIVEAAVLSTRIGEVFTATVISAGNGKGPGNGRIQLSDPAVTARCTGEFVAGTRIAARLIEAEIATGTVLFEATRPPS
ncbi:RNB domain-containing ribonuclease [Glaciibacter psychrotolerans]|uniref:Exoribonuclease R n=1 Tax=Glaciibacter psychrotolerans TaxID=670054 RepID=A0A7Z0EEE2_9MICO|nr:RNB domain-containing ribonuclease [Leifsonia psychrotolerans]NYJ20025.1 exoribonuclease R [Leifsonia psychrotolerans]